VSVEGLVIRLIERYKRDADNPGIAVRKVEDKWVLRRPSPDGRYVSFGGRDGNLAVRDLTTGEQRDITDDGNLREAGPKRFCGYFFPTWSPDGVQIAYLWNNEGSRELRIIGIDRSKPRVLYRSEDPALGIVPYDWSQDGKFILARRGLGIREKRDIVLVSVADGSVRTLRSLEGGFGPWGARLSPDGRYIVHDRPVKENNGFRDLFLLATDGSGEESAL
jgi:Tol biopolymer transport system component